MKKSLLFLLALLIPIAIMGVSIYQNDMKHIQSSYFLLLSFCSAFAASSFKEFKQIKISTKTKRSMIISFVVSVAIIITSSILNQIYMGCIVAAIIGICQLWMIARENSSKG